MLEVLLKNGIDKNLVEVIRRLYTNTLGQVLGDNYYFKSTMGVRQGCPMSPLLFSLFFGRVVQHVTTEVQPRHMLHVGGIPVPPALYADDVALLAPIPSSLTK